MLLRVAQQKHKGDCFRHLQLLADQLLLPWLCPAQCIHGHGSGQRRTITTRGRERLCLKQPASAASLAVTARRDLATAVAEQQPSYDEYVPFEGSSALDTGVSHGLAGSKAPSEVGSFGVGPPIIVREIDPRRDMRSNRARVAPTIGLGSDMNEIHAVLEACIRVHRIERAIAILRRLQAAYLPEARALLAAHNKFVAGLVDYLFSTRSEEHMRLLLEWVEMEMQLKGVQPDASTYAYLLKASIHMIQGPKLERAIRRYMDMAAHAQLDLEVLSLPILSDAELYTVAQAYPMEYLPADLALEEPEVPSAAEVSDPYILPDLRSVQQKGLGLGALKKSISIFSDTPLEYPHELKGTQEEKDRAYARMRQQKIEEDATTSAIERWREESQSLKKLGLDPAMQTKALGAWMWEWQRALKEVLEEELRLIEKFEGKEPRSQVEQDRRTYGPFLRLLPADRLSATTILATINLLSRSFPGHTMRLVALTTGVGNAVFDETIADAIQRQQPWNGPNKNAGPTKLAQRIKRRRAFDHLASGAPRKDLEPHSAVGGDPPQTWTSLVKLKVGAALVAALLRTAKIPLTRKDPETDEEIVRIEPAFMHSYRYLNGRRTGVIVAHPMLTAKLREEPARPVLAKHLPMVVPPKKWTGFREGGFLQFPVSVMRTKDDGAQRQYLDIATRRGDMDQVFAGLNFLARTPWKVNRPVFEVMRQAWNAGEAIGELAPAEYNVEEPPEPDALSNPAERRAWLRAYREAQNKRAAMHSIRCFQNFQLEVARAYLNEKFYFPHNMDFRGRAYPIPPYLNQMLADNCRGLLVFADGKELGPNGLDWLKVHLANLWGFDKATLRERREFTKDHLADIYDSASAPLTGRRWWLRAEDPWQTLATCMELKNALESPDPTRFVSHLPIHQDGTCNGLQHYAALGGDVWGAKQVNLEPSDRPADVYSAVAELVRIEAAKDAEAGSHLAKTVLPYITRKVVKTTVMTNVYGVTQSGARLQVRKNLLESMPDLTALMALKYAGYVAAKISEALSTMFQGAHEIQHWLGECAGRICRAVTPEQIELLKSRCLGGDGSSADDYLATAARILDDKDIVFKTTVIWTTPLKMPIVQPYFTTSTRIVATSLQRIHLQEERANSPVHRPKQLQAFPPNFIHSLDASHMLLCALECEGAGLTFAAIHDSFWTHAGDVDMLNKLLRKTFIRIHTEDIIGRLAAEFRLRYGPCLYLASVPGESPVGQRIKAWRASGSAVTGGGRRRKATELLHEYERQQLLRSENPDDRAKGGNMVTPASIFEDMASEDDLAPERKRAGLGIAIADDLCQGSTDQDLVRADLGTDGEEQADADADEEKGMEAEDDEEVSPKEEGEPVSKKRKIPKITFWRPMTFPAQPKKGGFDVSRLADSRYFFC